MNSQVHVNGKNYDLTTLYYKSCFSENKCPLNGYNDFHLHTMPYIYVTVADKKEHGGIVFCEEGPSGGLL